MSFQRKKTTKGAKGGRRTGQPSLKGPFTAIGRVTGKNTPFKLAQTTSGLGAISANNTGPSLTAVSQVYIDPYTLGSRAALLAAEFAQYRVAAMTIQYIADTTASGVVNSQSGPTTTPSYGSRPFALGWFKDPTVTPGSNVAIVEAGGFNHNTARDSRVLKIPSSPWLWTSSANGYPATAADLRLTAHGMLACQFVDASTTAAATYGRFEICWDIEFRYPHNVSVIGAEEEKGLSDIEDLARQEWQASRKAVPCKLPVEVTSAPDQARPGEPSERKTSSTNPASARNMRPGDPLQGATGWFR